MTHSVASTVRTIYLAYHQEQGNKNISEKLAKGMETVNKVTLVFDNLAFLAIFTLGLLSIYHNSFIPFSPAVTYTLIATGSAGLFYCLFKNIIYGYSFARGRAYYI